MDTVIRPSGLLMIEKQVGRTPNNMERREIIQWEEKRWSRNLNNYEMDQMFFHLNFYIVNVIFPYLL